MRVGSGGSFLNILKASYQIRISVSGYNKPLVRLKRWRYKGVSLHIHVVGVVWF